jgi:predicted HTH domain antitoxin
METVSLEVKIPASLLFTVQKSRKEIEKDVQTMLALQLFRERQISAGEAAELAGMKLADFMVAVRQQNPSYVQPTDDKSAAKRTDRKRKPVSPNGQKNLFTLK